MAKHHKFSQRSLDLLTTVHPDLAKIAHRALELSNFDFGITEGRREISRQFELVSQKKSRTFNSRHLHNMAIDIAIWINGGITWEGKYYSDTSKAFYKAAKEFDIPITWGGDWDSDPNTPNRFNDLVHYELQREFYPDNPVVIAQINAEKTNRGVA